MHMSVSPGLLMTISTSRDSGDSTAILKSTVGFSSAEQKVIVAITKKKVSEKREMRFKF